MLTPKMVAEVRSKRKIVRWKAVSENWHTPVASKLLRHLHALAAPADGEALARRCASFAQYHEEHAQHGGASREFHERAHTFLLDVPRLVTAAHAAGIARSEEERAELDAAKRKYGRSLDVAEAELARWRWTMLASTPEEANERRRDARDGHAAEVARLTAERDALQRHFSAAGPEHNLLALVDLYHARMTEARAESESLSGQLANARIDERQRIVDAIQERLDEESVPDAESAFCDAIAIARNGEGDLSPAEDRAEALAVARADGAREEREEIENMIGDDTHSGVAAVAPYLIERLRTRGGR